jgi:hypothetical protein
MVGCIGGEKEEKVNGNLNLLIHSISQIQNAFGKRKVRLRDVR